MALWQACTWQEGGAAEQEAGQGPSGAPGPHGRRSWAAFRPAPGVCPGLPVRALSVGSAGGQLVNASQCGAPGRAPREAVGSAVGSAGAAVGSARRLLVLRAAVGSAGGGGLRGAAVGSAGRLGAPRGGWGLRGAAGGSAGRLGAPRVLQSREAGQAPPPQSG
ncbi:hypothetical protein NDU88_008742 [Pleurodeles waltl]|uniref:Uncharacterized protein n=1 Tax=Pleurodeles waltl TaxID=8319 RepID=A0AAV7P047_PLEWA|nr:hypothetical protein NDU88_008742 [Pleurodeles waltl]